MGYAERREVRRETADATGRRERSGRYDPANGAAHPHPPYWLVIKRAASAMEVLTLGLAGGEEALPVFSFREEANTFLRSCYGDTGSDNWWIRKTGAGELLTLLNTYHTVEKVALDPLPEAVSSTAMDLFCVSRSMWMDLLAGRGRSWFQNTL